ncbi:MFS transporter [Streptomyces diastaticus]|uniref:MFS transporter n=1 Tax=Streptomyces diastaticus subsp. diastaticus TaxID=68040 RepID=A0ABQ1CQZ9_STRDI|nr:MFS transporter [Streptomyces diastaticus]GFH72802.1 MFS transporter [Streptomyces diastaticus subsp. diastaticus]GFH72902.1 MFS transporter [Streptomyces diastaticus subsp. diastaticus]GGU43371.1 MFS transporter [Streptomyces diastaticus subsp. diastaticus]
MPDEQTHRPPGLRQTLATLSGPLRFLLFSSFLIPLGSFMVLPFMSVFLHERLDMGLGTVGVILAVASLVQFSGGVVGGAMAERVGLRRTMVWALVIRTAGFIGLLLALRWPPLAMGALLLTCCGAALYLPANKAYLVNGVDEERRPAFLSAGNAALNAGMAVGPLIAGPFVLSSPGWLFLSVTGLFVMVTVGHARLPTEAAGETGPTVHGTGGLLTGIAGLPFAANALAFYLYFHFQHYLAVYAVERTSSQFYSLVLLLCFVLVIVVQPPASGLIRRMPYPLALAVGFAGLAAGLATLAIGTTWALLAGGALITLGDIVLFLKNDLEALRRSPRSDAVVFGQQRLAAGLGACASGVLGGQLYGLGQGLGDTGWFWLLAAGQCLLLPPLLLLRRPRVRRRPPYDMSKGAMTTDDTNRRVPGR